MVVQSNIRVVLRGLKEFTERIVKRIVLDATANLIEDTPVDTGWARANWIPGIGAPPAQPTGSPKDVGSGIAAQQQGVGSISVGYTLEQGNVNITNNVPYIRRLNEGHSTKAPPMFVQMALARAVQSASTLKSP